VTDKQGGLPTGAVAGRISPHSKYYQGLDIKAKRHHGVKLASLGSLGDVPYDAAGLKKSTNSQVEWQHWPSIE
jgi:hypothetical protein